MFLKKLMEKVIKNIGSILKFHKTVMCLDLIDLLVAEIQ